MTTRITISIPEDVADTVDSRLEYGDNRSAWIQSAIEYRLRNGVSEADLNSPSDGEMKRVSFSIPDDVAQAVDDQLSYKDSRSEWIRRAIQQYLAWESDTGNIPSAVAN